MRAARRNRQKTTTLHASDRVARVSRHWQISYFSEQKAARATSYTLNYIL